MKEQEIKISEITISIGRKEIHLTPDEAKRLHEALSEMFKEKVIHEHHYDWWYNQAVPVRRYPEYTYLLNTNDNTAKNSVTLEVNSL